MMPRPPIWLADAASSYQGPGGVYFTERDNLYPGIMEPAVVTNCGDAFAVITESRREWLSWEYVPKGSVADATLAGYCGA